MDFRVLVKVFVATFAALLIWSDTVAADMDISIHKVNQSPIIDGVLEDVWHQGDSVCEFTQNQPESGMPCSEPTAAYLLQDDRALYIAFKCETVGRSPDCRTGTRENQSGDAVFIYLDTFRDKRNAYCFFVNCAGVQGDATISSNGNEENSSWDGVFGSAVVADDRGYVVEIAIPWSTLRFDKSASVWGINLKRCIPLNSEIAYYCPVGKEERFTVSGFASLSGVCPARPSLGMELFPQVFYRTETSYGEESEKFQPSGDFNWAMSSSARLQTTVNPDFSQVEADPFALNLSKYAYYFNEMRPFFTEGQEYFQPLGSVMAGQFELFYSRQIGKKLYDGSEVPLELGSRLIFKKGIAEFGSLAAKTGEKTYETYWGTETEQSALFTVQRLGLQLTSNSTVGLMYAGKHTQDSRNDVISIDGSTSSNRFEFTYQAAQSYFDGTSDWALNSYLFWLAPANLVMTANAQWIGDNFDVSEIGYVPWRGYEYYSLCIGPVTYPKDGPLVYGAIKSSASFEREFWESTFSQDYGIVVESAWRNGWGASLGGTIGREYELGESYNPGLIWCNLHGDMSRRFIFTSYYSSSYGYDYLLSHFARTDYASLYTALTASEKLTFSLRSTMWIQREPDGAVNEVTYLLRPNINYGIMKGMGLSLFEETPFTESHGAKSIRIGLSYKYNFLPKSWLIIAFNDYEYRYSAGVYETMERVFTVKLKHLFSW